MGGGRLRILYDGQIDPGAGLFIHDRGSPSEYRPATVQGIGENPGSRGYRDRWAYLAAREGQESRRSGAGRKKGERRQRLLGEGDALGSDRGIKVPVAGLYLILEALGAIDGLTQYFIGMVL